MRHVTEHGAEKAFGVKVEKLMRMQADYDTAVMRRLREEAERRQTTASELVEAGLRRVLSERIPAGAGSEALTPLPTWRGGEPLVDITDRDALYRVMEEE